MVNPRGRKSKKVKRKKTWFDWFLLTFMYLFLMIGLIIIGYRLFLHLKDAQLQKKVYDVSADFDLPVDTADIDSDFIDKLREVFSNPDIIAYIVVPDAGIEYPVLQGETNDTYLRHDVHGNYTIYGSIFLDSICSPDFTDRTSLIYGHHMLDKTMFGGLEDAFSNGVEGKYFMIYTRDKALRYDLLCSTRTEAYGVNPYLGEAGYSVNDFVDGLRSRSIKWSESTSYSDTSKFVSLMTCWGDGKTYRYGVTGVLKERFYIKDDLAED